MASVRRVPTPPRTEGQTTVTISLVDDLLREMDDARGPKARSAYIREAIYEKLERADVKVDPAWLEVPDRTGKVAVARGARI